MRPNLGAIYVKDFAWESNKPVNVPLGDGLAQPLFQKIAQDGLVGPLSLHMEYIDHRPSHLLEQRWEAIANDMLTLKKWLGQRAG